MSQRKKAAKRARRAAKERAATARAAQRPTDSLSSAAKRAIAAPRWMVFGAIAAISQPTAASAADGRREGVSTHAAAVVDRSSYLTDPDYLWDPEYRFHASPAETDEVRLAAAETDPTTDPAAADRKSTTPGIRFDIAPGRLSVVLDAYSARSGVEVELAEPSLARGRVAGCGRHLPARRRASS